jgi:hypothetical protein
VKRSSQRSQSRAALAPVWLWLGPPCGSGRRGISELQSGLPHENLRTVVPEAANRLGVLGFYENQHGDELVPTVAT